jgi:hypothetical protein
LPTTPVATDTSTIVTIVKIANKYYASFVEGLSEA